jgi:cholesterol oxidase
VRYASGSGFFRTMVLPHAPGPTVLARFATAARGFFKQPLLWARALVTSDFAKHSQVLLYMRTLEGTLSMRLGRNAFTGFQKGLVTKLDDPKEAPRAFMEEATDLARRFAEKVKGVSMSLVTETVLGVPSTAHILGGCCIGANANEGVIDSKHHVFGYDGLYVIDGSVVSANPGVNPSLTITAMAERAMSFVPMKASATASTAA